MLGSLVLDLLVEQGRYFKVWFVEHGLITAFIIVDHATSKVYMYYSTLKNTFYVTLVRVISYSSRLLPLRSSCNYYYYILFIFDSIAQMK